MAESGTLCEANKSVADDEACGPVLFELKGEDDVRECGKKEGLNDGWEGDVKGKVMPCHQGGKKAKVKNEGSEREVDQRERERESEHSVVCCWSAHRDFRLFIIFTQNLEPTRKETRKIWSGRQTHCGSRLNYALSHTFLHCRKLSIWGPSLQEVSFN